MRAAVAHVVVAPEAAQPVEAVVGDAPAAAAERAVRVVAAKLLAALLRHEFQVGEADWASK